MTTTLSLPGGQGDTAAWDALPHHGLQFRQPHGADRFQSPARPPQFPHRPGITRHRGTVDVGGTAA